MPGGMAEVRLSLDTGKVMYRSHMEQGLWADWFAWHVHCVGYLHRWLKLLIMVMCLVIIITLVTVFVSMILCISFL
jgi:hypothetical protein